MGHMLPRIVCTLLLSSVCSLSALAAPQSKQPPPAPVPPQILAAKRVFISNAGGDAMYTRAPDQPYNQFYAAVKSWGRYELVASPADADVFLEISLVVHDANVVHSGGGQLYDPQLHLLIRDPKTNAILWGFLIHVDWAILQGNRDKNFDAAMKKLIESVQKLAPPTASGAPPQN